MALQLIQLVWHISVEPLAPFPPQSTFLIYVLTSTHFFPATIAALARIFQIFTLCVTLYSPQLERAEKKNLLSSSTGKEENLFCQRFTLFSSSFINNPSRKFPPPPWTRNLCHSGGASLTHLPSLTIGVKHLKNTQHAGHQAKLLRGGQREDRWRKNH